MCLCDEILKENTASIHDFDEKYDETIFNLFVMSYFLRGKIKGMDEYGYNYWVNEFRYFKLYKELLK